MKPRKYNKYRDILWCLLVVGYLHEKATNFDFMKINIDDFKTVFPTMKTKGCRMEHYATFLT